MNAPKKSRSTKETNAAERFVVECRIRVSMHQNTAITETMKRTRMKGGVIKLAFR
jgi:hypothetical protein